MKPAFAAKTILVCALAPVAWTQGVGACSSQSVPHETESYRGVPETNRNSSLAHYRIAEALLRESKWQSAANEFREALNGDLDPKWTEVWSHINLGRIFNTTNQRDRALNEYRQARRTGDNTFDAQYEVARLLDEMGIEIQPSARILDMRVRAEPLRKVPAGYTGEARIAELEGCVLLEGTIGEDGMAHDLTVVRPLGLGLDEKAVQAVRQWLFLPGRTNEQTASMRVLIAVDFFLSSKVSRWHLIRADFSMPSGGARPAFLSAKYPLGAGIVGKPAIEEGRLLVAMGRPATATVSFDIDEGGIPVNIQAGAASELTWGPEAAALVSAWRFKPGAKDGRPVKAHASMDLIWGPRNLTVAIFDRVRNAFVDQESGSR
jgi:TonB family protein